MDTTYRVAVIGTGLPWKTEGSTGFGMSRAHAPGYLESGVCEIVALADINEAAMARFNADFCGGTAAQFTDYQEMLAAVKPDIVSIATWPHLHAEMTIAAAEAGVKAIHCEKPMAGTFGEARRMAEVCAAHGVQLTFNHQRRHLPAFQTAKRLVDAGEIGDLIRFEGSCPNMLDWGTHWLNMFLMLGGEPRPMWVMAQVDARRLHKVYGVTHDTEGVAVIGYEGGLFGTLHTGEHAEKLVGCSIRAIGTEGFLELHNTGPHLRVRGKGDASLRLIDGPDTEGGLHGGFANTKNVVDLVQCLGTGATPLCDVSNALATTEIIYAIYESARRRGRIDLPLTIDDHPLDALVQSGAYPSALNP